MILRLNLQKIEVFTSYRMSIVKSVNEKRCIILRNKIEIPFYL